MRDRVMQRHGDWRSAIDPQRGAYIACTKQHGRWLAQYRVEADGFNFATGFTAIARTRREAEADVRRQLHLRGGAALAAWVRRRYYRAIRRGGYSAAVTYGIVMRRLTGAPRV